MFVLESVPLSDSSVSRYHSLSWLPWLSSPNNDEEMMCAGCATDSVISTSQISISSIGVVEPLMDVLGGSAAVI